MSRAKNNTGKKIFWTFYGPIALVCLALFCWYIVYLTVLKNNIIVPVTNYVDGATYSDDEKFLLELNLFDDVAEVKINYYTDSKLPEKDENGKYDTKFMMSTGAQFYVDSSKKLASQVASTTTAWRNISRADIETTLKNCTYYSMPDDGLEYGYVSGGTNLAGQNAWIWDINGKLVCIKESGYSKLNQKILWADIYSHRNISSLIAENIDSFYSLKDGVSVRMFDFSKYFDIWAQDEQGNFTAEVVDENILKEWTYVNVKVTKTSKNMISAKQSMFGSYKGNTEWNADGSQDTTLYWTDYNAYNLTENDFKFVGVDGSYELQIKQSCVDFLNEFSNLMIYTTINFDNLDSAINVVGFTEKPFSGLEQKIGKVKLISTNETKTFHVYDDSLEFETENVEVQYV